MNRVERKLLKVTDALAEVGREEELLRAELDAHRHLHDDARRDSAVYDTPVERLNVSDSGRDVERTLRALGSLRSRRARLEAQRDALLRRLSD